MDSKSLLYKKESYQLRGACFVIYNKFGSAREKTIERALLIELKDRGLKAESQVPLILSHKEEEIGRYLIDLVVENKIIVELKSKPNITITDRKQFWEYLKQSKYKLGFLVGFTPSELVIERFIYDKARK